MMVFDFNDKEMIMLRGLALERLRLIQARNAVSRGPSTDQGDIVGIMGEYAVVKLLRAPVYLWNALWSRDLPDVGDYEVRTRRKYMDFCTVNQSTLDKCHKKQQFMFCYADVAHRSCTVAGWAYAYEIQDLAAMSERDNYRLLDPKHLRNVDDL